MLTAIGFKRVKVLFKNLSLICLIDFRELNKKTYLPIKSWALPITITD